MKISEYIVKFLNKRGIDVIFGYIGGYNADIIDVFCADKNNKFVLNYHEQASAFAVNTYSTLKNCVGVVTSSGAPSSCNLVAGIANAYFDSHPCVFLVGSPHSLALRPDKSIRQNAFEEIDMVSMVSDITKYAVKIMDAKDVKYELEKAFYIANEGRKGPVLIDIPYNIARTDIDIDKCCSFEFPKEPEYDKFDMQQILSKLSLAKRPVIMLGGGAGSYESRKLLNELFKKVKIPSVATLCGLDILPHNNECYSGFIGHYGNRYANLALANSDFVLILGSRLDERQLGGYGTTLQDDCFVVRVDIEKQELKRKINESLSYYSSVENFLKEFVKQDFSKCSYFKWINCIQEWKKRYPSLDANKSEMSSLNFISEISDYLPDDAVICADVGQNQMSVAQALKIDGDRRLFNSAGYGSMGFSLPAAIGCAYAKKGTCILSFNGDGGIQMNIQELQTLKRDNLPINIVVLNNQCLGMIRKTQEKLFDGRNYVSIEGYTAPDFEPIAKAYDIPYLRIDSVDKYKRFKDFVSDKHPTFTEICLPTIMENTPEPGACLDMQTPILTEKEFELIKKECTFDE